MKSRAIHSSIASALVLGLFSLSCERSPVSPSSRTTANPAVYNLPSGWQSEVIVSNMVSSPVSMADSEGTMFLLDRCGDRVLKIEANGTFSNYTTTGGVALDGIAYDPGRRCLLGNSRDAVYSITQSSTTLIGKLSDGSSASTVLVDPRDNSIFAVDWINPGYIRQYDSSMKFVKAVVATNFCLNIAIDTQNNTLYYSESPLKSVSALNLATGQATVIRTNIGNGSPQENIGVTVGDSGIVYYSSIWDGLFGYSPAGRTETKVMDIPQDVGVGRIYWWKNGKAVLMTTALAGAIVKMEPGKSEAELMEPNVNTSAIVGRKDGKVFLYQTGQLYMAENGTVTRIGGKSEGGDLALDLQENLYTAADRFISAVDVSSGAKTALVTFDEGHSIARIEFDPVKSELVVATEFNNKQYTMIWRTSLASGSVPRKLISLQVENPDSLTACDQIYDMTVDRTTGNVYVLNKVKETISRLNESTGTLDTLLRKDILNEENPNLVGFNYFSPMSGFILTYLEERKFLPLNRASLSHFNSIGCGMDAQPGYEDANGHFVCTHAGHVVRIRR